MEIQVAYMGRSYSTAEALPNALVVSDGDHLTDAIGQLLSQHDLPKSCLVTLSGVHMGTLADYADRALREGDELVLIAPVAGGC